MLHLKYKLPLCKPEIEFKNLMGAKALATDHRVIREKLDLKPQKGIDKFVTVTGPEGGHLKKADLHSLKVKQPKNQPL